MTFAGFPFWLAVPASIAAMAVFGIALERVVIRPDPGPAGVLDRHADHGHRLRRARLITMIPASAPRRMPCRCPTRTDLEPRGLVLAVEQMVVIGATGCCALLYALFATPKVGIAMQAASQNQIAAYYMGIPGRRLNALGGSSPRWRRGRRAAARAHHLRAREHGLHRLKAFPAAVVGGFGSLPGAIVGGLVIGHGRVVVGLLPARRLQDIAAYIVVVLVMLVVRPNGLFGEKLRKKVTSAPQPRFAPSPQRGRPSGFGAVPPGGAGLIMRFIFKTSYDQDIRSPSTAGRVFWYGLLRLLVAWRHRLSSTGWRS